MAFVKRYIWWVVLGAVFYFLLSYHLVFIDNTVRFLKKSELSLEYTFYSVKSKTVESILANDVMRRDGIGHILLEEGKISEQELGRLTRKYEGR